VDAGVAMQHQTLLVEPPVLIAVSTKPVAGIVVVFVGETHCDPVVGERPEFLNQAIVEFAIPLTYKKFYDLVAPFEDFGAITPFAVNSIGERQSLGIARVPPVLRSADLLDRRFAAEGWQRRSNFRHLKSPIGGEADGLNRNPSL